jgi:hypothetical protein
MCHEMAAPNADLMQQFPDYVVRIVSDEGRSVPSLSQAFDVMRASHHAARL